MNDTIHSALPPPTRRNKLPDLVWLAVTLAVLSLGLAVITWEWCSAHGDASSKTPDVVRRQHAKRNPPEKTSLRGDQ
jgi:hypothetical protein